MPDQHKKPEPGWRTPADALGVATDLPATVPTECGRLRPVAMTTVVPEKVTCLARAWRELAARFAAA